MLIFDRIQERHSRAIIINDSTNFAVGENVIRSGQGINCRPICITGEEITC